MPCMKCSSGKYKYGRKGRCQFNSLSHCKRAEKAIHTQKSKRKMRKK